MTDKQIDEMQSKRAWDVLKAAFGSQHMLSENLLQEKTPGAIAVIQRQLKTWTESLPRPDVSLRDRWYGSAEMIDECNSKLGVFRTGKKSPFVTVKRYFFR